MDYQAQAEGAVEVHRQKAELAIDAMTKWAGSERDRHLLRVELEVQIRGTPDPATGKAPSIAAAGDLATVHPRYQAALAAVELLRIAKDRAEAEARTAYLQAQVAIAAMHLAAGIVLDKIG